MTNVGVLFVKVGMIIIKVGRIVMILKVVVMAKSTWLMIVKAGMRMFFDGDVDVDEDFGVWGWNIKAHFRF